MSPLHQHAPAGTPGTTTTTGTEPQRFRGRTLEELLPQIRAALGPDAVVLRRREGLAGGVGGFFQTRFVEVEAVAGQAPGFDAYDDEPAWPEDVAADGVRWLDEAPAPARPVGDPPPRALAAEAADVLRAVDGGAPIDGAAFLRHLDAAVERRRATAPGATDEPFLSDGPTRSTRPAGGRGLLDGLDDVPEDAGVAEAAASGAPTAADPSPVAGPSAAAVVAPWRPARATSGRTARDAPAEAARRRPGTAVPVAVPDRRDVDADVAEYGLIARGLTPSVARSVVLEAAAHGQPLDPGHRIDRATRAALARRLPRTGPREHVRTLVVVGGPGSGRTSAVGAIASAHARVGRRVLAVAMGALDGGAALAAAVVGTDVELLVAAGGATVAAAVAVARPDVCVVDTPAVSPQDPASVDGLAAELRALGADEVHLALPGTHATTAALGVLDGLAALRPDALLMTHRDRAERPGGLLGASILRDLPIAYVTDGHAAALADPARLARMVQP